MHAEFGPTLYDQLGVAPDADAQLVKRALRSQMRATHPDTTGVDSHVQFDLVQRAGQVLTDPARRAAYDTWLARRAPAADPPVSSSEDDGARAPQDTGDPREPHAQVDEDGEPVPDPGPENTGARTTTIVLAACAVAIAAGVLLTVLSAAGSSEEQLVGLAAATLIGIGAWTWRTAGWRPRAMLVACGLFMAAGVLPYVSGRYVPHSTFEPIVQVPIGMALVVLGAGIATWRLAARRRSKYEWVLPT